jgi:hypothetical protein
MGNSRYSAEDRKANQDAHEARMAQFAKAEAGAKARQEAADDQKTSRATATPEPASKEPDAVDSAEGESE